MNSKHLFDEHDKQNNEYIQFKAGLFSKEPANVEGLPEQAGKRLDGLIKTLNSVTKESIHEAPSYVAVIDTFVSLFDDLILECALITGRRNEVESKLLDLCKEALGGPTAERTRDTQNEHVVSLLIDGLVLHELPIEKRGMVIGEALINETNPLRMGLTFFEKFSEKYPEYVNKQLMDYLKSEESVRLYLALGKGADATETLTRMYEMPINTSEKLLLIALNSFYGGFNNDAVRAVEIGLKMYPGNERLLNAQRGLTGAQ